MARDFGGQLPGTRADSSVPLRSLPAALDYCRLTDMRGDVNGSSHIYVRIRQRVTGHQLRQVRAETWKLIPGAVQGGTSPQFWYATPPSTPSNP